MAGTSLSLPLSLDFDTRGIADSSGKYGTSGFGRLWKVVGISVAGLCCPESGREIGIGGWRIFGGSIVLIEDLAAAGGRSIFTNFK